MGHAVHVYRKRDIIPSREKSSRICLLYFVKSQEQIEQEREHVNATLVSLEEELDSCRDQGEHWKSQLDATSQELQQTQQT